MYRTIINTNKLIRAIKRSQFHFRRYIQEQEKDCWPTFYPSLKRNSNRKRFFFADKTKNTILFSHLSFLLMNQNQLIYFEIINKLIFICFDSIIIIIIHTFIHMNRFNLLSIVLCIYLFNSKFLYLVSKL